MDELREQTEPHQAVGDADQLRLRDLDQTEAGRDDVHFLLPSFTTGWAPPQPHARDTCLVPPTDRTGPTPAVKISGRREPTRSGHRHLRRRPRHIPRTPPPVPTAPTEDPRQA